MYCPYNPALDCDDKDRHCDRCGWNPEVEAERKFKTRQKIAQEEKKKMSNNVQS